MLLNFFIQKRRINNCHKRWHRKKKQEKWLFHLEEWSLTSTKNERERVLIFSLNLGASFSYKNLKKLELSEGQIQSILSNYLCSMILSLDFLRVICRIFLCSLNIFFSPSLIFPFCSWSWLAGLSCLSWFHDKLRQWLDKGVYKRVFDWLVEKKYLYTYVIKMLQLYRKKFRLSVSELDYKLVPEALFSSFL